jgi:hypothetical protein
LRREREQHLRAETSKRVEELTAALEAAERELGRKAQDPAALSQGLPPAGWYTDPQDEARLRYWDGEAWTDWTHDQRGLANNEPSEPATRLGPEQAATPQTADQSTT